MRIAYVTHEYVTEQKFPGGTANHLGRVCAALADAGHEVTVFVASKNAGGLQREGVEIRRVPIDHPLLVWAYRATLYRMMRPVTWLFQGYLLNRALRAAHRRKPFDIVQYTSYGGGAFFRPREVPAVMRISSHLPSKHRTNEIPISLEIRILYAMYYRTIRLVDAPFCPSRILADAVEKTLGRPVDVIEPPFPPVVRGEAAPEGIDIPSEARYLLTFGQLSPLKGVDVIGDVLPDVLADHPDLHWVFIGRDGANPARPIMHRVMLQAGPCRDRVHYPGPMTHDRLFPILDKALAVVLPSRLDNLPNTCLEAMALGRVVIGTRGASFDQLIEDGKNGFLCDIGSPESLRAAVERVLALSDGERAAMGARAARRIDQLRPEKAVARLVGFYRKVIAARNPRQGDDGTEVKKGG